MMKTTSETSMWRYNLVALGFAVFTVLLVVQVVRIQFMPASDIFIGQFELNTGYYRTIIPARGVIYDRLGRIMAGNTMVYEVGVELRDVRNAVSIARTLESVVGADYNRTFALASITPSSQAVYVPLVYNVTPEQKAQLEQIAEDLSAYSTSRDEEITPPSLKGLIYRPYLQRSFPEREVGSNVIGFVNSSGDGYGLEKKYNELLAGSPLTVWVPLDPNRVEEIPDVPEGASLVLTLNREIQSAMEQVADNAMAETGAQSATIVVMDPTNGEILAMAATPRMDLNNFYDYKDIFTGNTPFNRAVSQSYETGSVFKIFTMAAGLDSGTVEPETVFVDTGVYQIGGINIYNWNRGAWGPQTMLGCMQHSLNVCMAWIADELGAGTFYRYMDAFGFGRSTGIELAGEDPGRLKMPGDEDWYMSDLGTNSFGQAVTATPVQMLMAASAIANEGRMVAPHIIRSIVNNGHQYNTPYQVVGTPITAETGRTLTTLLAESLEKESSIALVEGYRLAGKTGTAQIATQYGYDSSLTNASFIGWGPIDDPRFIVYVWLEKPTASIWASEVAAPVFRTAVERLVVLMDLPPDHIRLQMNEMHGQ